MGLHILGACAKGVNKRRLSKGFNRWTANVMGTRVYRTAYTVLNGICVKHERRQLTRALSRLKRCAATHHSARGDMRRWMDVMRMYSVKRNVYVTAHAFNVWVELNRRYLRVSEGLDLLSECMDVGMVARAWMRWNGGSRRIRTLRRVLRHALTRAVRKAYLKWMRGAHGVHASDRLSDMRTHHAHSRLRSVVVRGVWRVLRRSFSRWVHTLKRCTHVSTK